jgi:Zn-dependent peptidase ImmA (M78 family)
MDRVAMPNEQIPINPSLVSWARERVGLTIEEAGRTFHRIAEWETGESFPTYAQLENLSAKFKLPIAVFFFPAPPKIPPIKESFRTLPDAEFESLPSRIRILLRKAKALQINLSELTQGRNPAKRIITEDLPFDRRDDIGGMVAEVRAYLGVALDQQIGWPDIDTALKSWRRALVEAGVFVFKDAFRVEEFSGFCLYDDIFPIIYVNNSSAKTRQIFTLFHELAHLLFHTSGIDTLTDEYVPRLTKDAQAIEILCNRFAAQFLVPEDALTKALVGREVSEATAEGLAVQFHVSREMIFRRFLDRGLIDQARYERAVKEWTAQYQGSGAGGDYYWTKLAYLGREYVELALSQYQKNRIDETQLAEYLDTKPRNIGALEEYFERSAA